VCPFPWGELGPHLTECECRLGRHCVRWAYRRTTWHLDPYPTVCLQYSNVTRQTDKQTNRQRSDSVGREVGRTVFRRPFVKGFTLCYQAVVCPVLSVCLSVCNIGVLGPNGWMIKIKLGMQVGLGPLDEDQLPLPQRGTDPNFRSIYDGQIAGCIKMPLNW